MGSFISDLKQNFQRGSIGLQLIYINVGVFVVTTLISVFLMLFNWDVTSWLSYLELPASLSQFLVQPWSLLTYMFLHANAAYPKVTTTTSHIYFFFDFCDNACSYFFFKSKPISSSAFSSTFSLNL